MFNLIINLVNLCYILENHFIIIRKKKRKKKKEKGSLKKKEERIKRKYPFLIFFSRPKIYLLSLLLFTKKINSLFLLQKERNNNINDRLRNNLYKKT